MRDIKRRMEYYPSYDRSGIAAHLEAMAARGLILERITSSFWYYRRSASCNQCTAFPFHSSASFQHRFICIVHHKISIFNT